jgi:hypothetical protein
MPQKGEVGRVGDRRYYHFVAMRAKSPSLSAYWNRMKEFGDLRRQELSIPLESSHFAIEHRKLVLDKGYARGAVAQVLSERGNGRPPFVYDLFAARLTFNGNLFLMMGFPFVNLAIEAVSFVAEAPSFKSAEFQGVDLSELLSEKNRPIRNFEGLSSRVVGVQFVVTDDKSLTAVRLGGDDPFHAQIYRAFLKKKFDDGVWVPDHCVLACEHPGAIAARDGQKMLGATLRSRLHVDRAGNFKFYVHAGCANVALMPFAIGQLNSLSCLIPVGGNPLRKLPPEDGN